MTHIGKKGLLLVIVLLLNRGKFVIVTSSAVEWQSKTNSTDNIRDVVQHSLTGQKQVFVVVLFRIVAIERCRHLRLYVICHNSSPVTGSRMNRSYG